MIIEGKFNVKEVEADLDSHNKDIVESELGLSFTNEVVKKHQGNIKVEEINSGCCFHLTLKPIPQNRQYDSGDNASRVMSLNLV